MIYIARKGCGFDRVFRKVWLGISEAKLTAFCTKIGVDKDWCFGTSGRDKNAVGKSPDHSTNAKNTSASRGYIASSGSLRERKASASSQDGISVASLANTRYKHRCIYLASATEQVDSWATSSLFGRPGVF
jgi:hypothetical protein